MFVFVKRISAAGLEGQEDRKEPGLGARRLLGRSPVRPNAPRCPAVSHRFLYCPNERTRAPLPPLSTHRNPVPSECSEALRGGPAARATKSPGSSLSPLAVPSPALLLPAPEALLGPSTRSPHALRVPVSRSRQRRGTGLSGRFGVVEIVTAQGGDRLTRGPDSGASCKVWRPFSL